jgi:hypothetical protein
MFWSRFGLRFVVEPVRYSKVDRYVAAVLVGAMGLLSTALFYSKYGGWAGIASLMITLGFVLMFLFGSVKLIRSWARLPS